MATTINDPASWVGRTLVGVDGSRLGTIAQVYTDDETGEHQWLAVSVGLGGTRLKYIPAIGAGPRGVKDVIGPWDKASLDQAGDRLPGSAPPRAPRAARKPEPVVRAEPEPEPEPEEEEAPAAAAPPRARRRSASNLTDIEGLGPDDAATLMAAKVRTIAALLKAGGAAAGRRALARETGIDGGTILEWVNRADLMRIKGVGSEYSDLLESAGVDSVRELSKRKPANLQARMAAVNDEYQLVRRAPNLGEVERWVEEAKTLPVAVTH